VAREGVLFAGVLCGYLSVGLYTGAHAIMTLTVAGSVLALVVATRFMRRLLPAALSGAEPAYDAPAWRQAALPLVIVTAVEALFDKTGVLILGLSGANRDAGIFALVFSMAMLVVLPRTAVDTMFAPRIARLYAEKKYGEVQGLVVKAALLSLAGGACVVAGLEVVARPVLGWFGSEFAAGETPLLILLLGQLFAAGLGSQLLVLAMTGNEADAARILTLSAAANLVMCTLLVGLFGLVGAAIATAAALVAWNVLMARDIWKKLQLWPGVVGLFRPAPV
jgi:O-antigen/teichoic acid export membrane protein